MITRKNVPLSVLLFLTYVAALTAGDVDVPKNSVPSATSTDDPSSPQSDWICKKILVIGNGRIAETAILSKLPIQIGTVMTEDLLNKIVKVLYSTKLFAWIRCAFAEGALTIQVLELPSVISVTFDGNSNVDTTTLEEELSVKTRQILSKDELRKSVMRISAIYRRMGYFKAQIEAQIIYRPQNCVDVIFGIEEGPASIVQDVIFLGNKELESSDLATALRTKPFRWWRILKAGSLYDPSLQPQDTSALRRYYENRGYLDFEVKHVSAQLSTLLEAFTIVYKLHEGKPYNVRDVILQNDIPHVECPKMYNYFLKKGKCYRSALAGEDMQKLEKFFARAGHPHVRVGEKRERHPDTHDVTVRYVTYTIPRVTVRRVNIVGNKRTYDRVLYPFLDVWEGDILDERNISFSRRALEKLGYFESVSVEKIPVPHSPQEMDVQYTVKEQPTGSLGLKGSYSRSLSGRIDLHFDEINLMGRGLVFKVNGAIGHYSNDFNASFYDPSFLGRNLLLGSAVRMSSQVARDVGRSTDREEYRVVIRGARLFATLPLSQYWSIRPAFGLSFEQLKNLGAKIYALRKGQFENTLPGSRAWQGSWLKDGKATVAKTTVGIAYDHRDRRFDATKGLFALLNMDVTGLFGDIKTWSLSLDLDYHHKLNDLFTLRVHAFGNMLRPWRDTDYIRVMDRYRLGGPDTLRGFSEWGVGPRYTFTEAVGGDTSIGGSIELLFPLGLPKEARFRGFFFLDMGTAWDHASKLPEVIFSNYAGLRLSAGIGIRWASPMGVISISYGVPLHSYQHDVIDRVNLGMKSAYASQHDFL